MYSPIETVQIPGLSVPDIFIQHQRLVLRQNADCINSGVDTVGKRKIDDPIFPAKRDIAIISFAIVLPPVLIPYLRLYNFISKKGSKL